MSDQATPAVSTAKVPQPEYSAEQILEQLVKLNRAHVLGINLLVAASGNGGGAPELTERIVNGSINLLNVLKQVSQVRYVASARGYTEILELLDQKLPYEK